MVYADVENINIGLQRGGDRVCLCYLLFLPLFLLFCSQPGPTKAAFLDFVSLLLLPLREIGSCSTTVFDSLVLGPSCGFLAALFKWPATCIG